MCTRSQVVSVVVTQINPVAGFQLIPLTRSNYKAGDNNLPLIPLFFFYIYCVFFYIELENPSVATTPVVYETKKIQIMMHLGIGLIGPQN